jgi:DNA-binding GntR family transcriptional regulator
MKIERYTLADAVHTRLRDEILNGELVDGQELNQVQIAQRFEVSRVPVREALQRLMAEGLVNGDPYRRVVVATVGASELGEMLAIREELEVFGLTRLLAGQSDVELQQARKLNKAFKTANDERRIDLDQQIHASFLGATPVAAKLVADIRQRSQKYLGHVRGGHARRTAAYEEHERILVAAEAGDAATALELLRFHIAATRRLLIGDAAADASGTE